MSREVPFDPRTYREPHLVAEALLYMGFTTEECQGYKQLGYIPEERISNQLIQAADVEKKEFAKSAYDLVMAAWENSNTNKLNLEDAIDKHRAHRAGIIRYGQDEVYGVVNAVLNRHDIAATRRRSIQSRVALELELYMQADSSASKTPWMNALLFDQGQMIRLQGNLDKNGPPVKPLAEEIYAKLLQARIKKNDQLWQKLMLQVSYRPATPSDLMNLFNRSTEIYAEGLAKDSATQAEQLIWNRLTVLYGDYGVESPNQVAHLMMQAMAQSAQAKPVDLVLAEARAETAVERQNNQALKERAAMAAIVSANTEAANRITSLAKTTNEHLRISGNMLRYLHKDLSAVQSDTRKALGASVQQMLSELDRMQQHLDALDAPKQLAAHNPRLCVTKPAPRIWLEKVRKDQPIDKDNEAGQGR